MISLEAFFESLWDRLRSGRMRMPDEPRSYRTSASEHPLISHADPPWDSWELDPEFFKAVSEWTIENPDTSLNSLLDNICVGIDRGRDFLELIPDYPFPARSLLCALGTLVKLGAQIARAKSEVQHFAKDVIGWVSDVRTALANSKGNKVEKYLVKMRALIEEICLWATARLQDGRWSSITNGLRIAQEISEFNTRIASARAIFTNLAIINLSHGLDTITREIEIVQKVQQEQLVGINRIQDTLYAQDQVEERRRFMKHMLPTRTVSNTTYDEQGKQPCDAGTRIDILKDIKTWVYDTSDRSQSFLWLTGDPGSGKSAITASVARECKDAGILWAQYFINRNNADTTDPRSYFPSIARQFADHIPDSEVARSIHAALKRKPSLIDDISTDQASGLFLNAITVAAKLNPMKPVVVVIDALDETSRVRLRATAEIFSELFLKLYCRNAKIFISSRTEEDIQKPFSKTFDVVNVKHIHLDTAAESSYRDVSYFLGRRIGRIVKDHDLNWEEWPGKERMQALCIRASGLFIWASTVVKFFEEQIHAMGRECLDDLLDALSTQGMDDINVLYGTILQIVYKKRDHSAWEFETFQRVVGCIVVLREPLCLAEIEDLLDLRQAPSRPRVDITNFVRRLRTILVPGTQTINRKTVPRLHKSFFEYITSERAESRLRVNSDISNGELAVKCLRQLASFGGTTVRNSSTDAVDPMPTALGYALQFGSSHLPQANGLTAGIAIIGHNTQPRDLRRLLHFSSNDYPLLKPLGVTLSRDRTQIVTSRENCISFWDKPEAGGQSIKRSCITRLKESISSVAFSPDGKQIVSGGDDGVIRIFDSNNGQPDAALIHGHTDSVRCITFSKNGEQIATGGADNTLRTWDLRSGSPISDPMIGHTGPITCIAFSPDGTVIVSGGKDRTLRLWDPHSGQVIGHPIQYHTDGVTCVAFSPDGTKIASGSDDCTVLGWNLSVKRQIGVPFKAQTLRVLAIIFSPDGKQVFSFHADNVVGMWDTKSGQRVGLVSANSGATGPAVCAAFSLDGRQVVSCANDGTVRVWDLQNKKPFGSPIKRHFNRVGCVGFSPDGQRIVSSGDSEDEKWTIRTWDLQPGQLGGELFVETHYLAGIGSFASSADANYIICMDNMNAIQRFDLKTRLPIKRDVEGDTKEIVSLVMSPFQSRVAAASLNGTVWLWHKDANSLRLASPPMESRISGFTSLRFSRDGATLTLTSVDGDMCRWDATNGQLIDSAVVSPHVVDNRTAPMLFSMKQGWSCDESGEADSAPELQWFPSHIAGLGWWAYVDGKVIRNNGGTSVTIVDLADISREP